MNALSIFDIFKIGIGPSSSHTLGPWKAASLFLEECKDLEMDNIKVRLFGSLSKTGKGHATDKAIILGLRGFDPKTIPVGDIESVVKDVSETKTLTVNNKEIRFDPEEHIIFENVAHERHPNTLTFEVYYEGNLVNEEVFASVGGGFVERSGELPESEKPPKLPHPINHGADIIEHTNAINGAISDVVYVNELAFGSAEEIEKKIETIVETMLDSVFLGCTTEGVLPGGLKVVRRAKSLSEKFTSKSHFKNRREWADAVRSSPQDFDSVNKWISCFALAVNEQNASLARVVTSPTNGAAGVIPAVMLYFLFFSKDADFKKLKKFLFTAGEIGCLFKKGATISAAVGGCQAEIGVSSAMAAAGLTEVMGGSPAHCLMAAEIAMEHHLGLTCDPIGGLVQVPCIERNALGAIKAITASNLALTSDPESAIVHIDEVIKTMWETAQDMHDKYKETSEGGLASGVSVALADC